MNEWILKFMNEWMNERTNEWMNELVEINELKWMNWHEKIEL